MKTEIEVLQELLKEVKLLNEKWMEALKSIPNKDEPYVHDYTAAPTFPTRMSFPNGTFEGGKQEQPPCLWDSVSEKDKARGMMLSCPCPKCTPQFL